MLNRYFPYTQYTKTLCAFPAIWTLLEWTRGWLFTGFPWLSLGYSQINSPLKGFAPLASVYFVTLMVVFSSGFIVSAILKFKQTQYKQVILLLLGFIVIWVAGFALSLVSWTQPIGKPIKVSLIQGNIAQQLKWSPDEVEPTLNRYLQLTNQHWDSQIIIWPESAVPVPIMQAAGFLDNLRTSALRHNATVIVGVPIHNVEQTGFYNAVIALGKGEGVYTKHRLVPFGEYIPMKKYLGRLLDFLEVPMSDFVPGVKAPQPITANGARIATFVCYEIAFPEQVVSRDGSINMILTVSNDAWFGSSIAQPQHLQIARMRALEMGRPVLFVANDGITAIINAKGDIQSRLAQFKVGVLTDYVQPTHGKTPWQYVGLDPMLVMAFALLIIAIRKHKT